MPVFRTTVCQIAAGRTHFRPNFINILRSSIKEDKSRETWPLHLGKKKFAFLVVVVGRMLLWNSFFLVLFWFFFSG